MVHIPKYFFLVFGDAYFEESPPEGGHYKHADDYLNNSGIEAGDVILLYCCGNCRQHANEIPAIGIVTNINQDHIFYQYLPLCHPIYVDWDSETMKKNLPELADNEGKRHWHLKGNWLRSISSNSFRATTEGRQIDWP
jgi:hypothetical protein